MVTIFMVFLPLSLAANLVASRTIADWPLVLRVVLVTTIMTPLMTYVLPAVDHAADVMVAAPLGAARRRP